MVNLELINNLRALRGDLARLRDVTSSLLVERKLRKAVADLHRAQTLIEKAEVTFDWAKQFSTRDSI